VVFLGIVSTDPWVYYYEIAFGHTYRKIVSTVNKSNFIFLIEQNFLEFNELGTFLGDQISLKDLQSEINLRIN